LAQDIEKKKTEPRPRMVFEKWIASYANLKQRQLWGSIHANLFYSVKSYSERVTD
jgi:hypothetical protein